MMVGFQELENVQPLSECGAKAFNLGVLLRAGVPTAPGFVISDRVFQLHVDRCGARTLIERLRRDLQHMGGEQIRDLSGELRDRIVDGDMDPRLPELLSKHASRFWPGKLAVRSSAVGEDSNYTSFAGQLESHLNIETPIELCIAVRKVWASLWSESALHYAKHQGLCLSQIGVLVQQQVDARWSGVLFTCDPRDATTEEMIVEFCAGLGEQLVSGAITPGRLRVARKDFAIRLDQHAEQGVLGSRELTRIKQLAELAIRLEEIFDGPQDIEWSIDCDNQLFILQSRPVTAMLTAKRQEDSMVCWSNANIAENFPDPVTPFLYSIVHRGYAAYFRNLGLSFGLSKSQIASKSATLDQIVGVHAGRLYYNLSNIHSLLYLLPGGKWLAQFFNQFTGADEYPVTQQPKTNWITRFVLTVRVVLRTTWQYIWIQSRVRNFEAVVAHFADRTHPDRLSANTVKQLAEHLREFVDIRLCRWNGAALADTAAMVCYGVLKYQLNRALADTDQCALHNNLLKGLPDLISSVPVVKLWDLSRLIIEDPALQLLFRESSPEEILNAASNPQFHSFFISFREYQDRWGFRSSGELMLTVPTPFEDPVPTMRVLQRYVMESGDGPAQVSAQQAVSREAATRRVMAILTPNKLLRVVPFVSRASHFRILLKSTQGAIRLRERARFKQALLYTRLRQIALELGQRFVDEGLIEHREHIFFLGVEEVAATAAGTVWSLALLRTTIAMRMQAYRCLPKTSPPDSFALAYGKQWSVLAESMPSVDAGAAASRLSGTSACGGIVQGTAVVAHNVGEAESISAGDILVTRQTDPGWASIFFLIKGLVIERGGMLSHGAIIAREYGIPAIVGVPDATRLIKSGETLVVNGDQGTVDIG